MNYPKKEVVLEEVSQPVFKKEYVPVLLSDATMKARKEKVLTSMRNKGLDCIIVYCDTEHGSNFEYLTGFISRFEESLLVLHASGEGYLLMGNENTRMVNYSRIEAKCIHVPFFSLPYQPMPNDDRLISYFEKAMIRPEMKVGLVGWKWFTSSYENNEQLFDLPHYVVKTIKEITTKVINVTEIFIDPQDGARVVNNANEIAHYEFGASLASLGVLQAMNAIEVGKSEMEIAALMNLGGQYNSVVTICATGDRFENANLYPSAKTIKAGDRLSLTVAYKGGLSSRAGYAVEKTEQLPQDQSDYLEVIVKPYFSTIATWLEEIHIGMLGKEMYALVDKILPQSQYNWLLNPGHLTADEEWLTSMVSAESMGIIQSGMLFQVDIIPSVKGYGGISVECTIALADSQLRLEIEKQYPELWGLIATRQKYIRDVIGINISDEVLPMSDTVAYCRPYLLDKNRALVVKK